MSIAGFSRLVVAARGLPLGAALFFGAVLAPGCLEGADGGGMGAGGAGAGASGGSAGAAVCDYPWEFLPARFEAYASGEADVALCGVQTWEPLPCGACSGEEVCSAGHTRECCGQPIQPGAPPSPLDSWLCACEDGAWSCFVWLPAASICPCSVGDAGTAGEGGDGSDAGTAAEYVICDGSEELRLGYQKTSSGLAGVGQPNLAQNGYSYLFVDGTCRYWAFGTSEAGQVGLWQPVRTGILTKERAAELSADLALAQFPAPPVVPGGCLDGGNAVWWTAEATFGGSTCSGFESVENLNHKTRAWVDELWGAGNDVDGPLRLEAIVMPESEAWPNQSLSPLSLALAPIATPYSGLGYDDAMLLVDDPASIAELRLEREHVVAGDYLKFDGAEHVLPVRQDGVLYWVFFRDTIPLEDPSGLIRPPN